MEVHTGFWIVYMSVQSSIEKFFLKRLTLVSRINHDHVLEILLILEQYPSIHFKTFEGTRIRGMFQAVDVLLFHTFFEQDLGQRKRRCFSKCHTEFFHWFYHFKNIFYFIWWVNLGWKVPAPIINCRGPDRRNCNTILRDLSERKIACYSSKWRHRHLKGNSVTKYIIIFTIDNIIFLVEASYIFMANSDLAKQILCTGCIEISRDTLLRKKFRNRNLCNFRLRKFWYHLKVLKSSFDWIFVMSLCDISFIHSGTVYLQKWYNRFVA